MELARMAPEVLMASGRRRVSVMGWGAEAGDGHGHGGGRGHPAAAVAIGSAVFVATR
jgi:hypothetical protein